MNPFLNSLWLCDTIFEDIYNNYMSIVCWDNLENKLKIPLKYHYSVTAIVLAASKSEILSLKQCHLPDMLKSIT